MCPQTTPSKCRARASAASASSKATIRVADEIETVRFSAAEEFEQSSGLTTGCAEMGVGDPDRAEVERVGGDRAHRGICAPIGVGVLGMAA